MNKFSRSPFLREGAWIAAAMAASLLVFKLFGVDMLSTGTFMPHIHCYLDDPKMVWLHVGSDLAIGLAYVSISSTLAFLVYKASRDIPFHWMLLAFGIFIVSCGFTHFMEIWTVWKPVYWLAGYVKVITAVASVTTAIALFPLVPKIFSLINAVKVSEERRVGLEAANADLDAFASSVSHDLRAPLRAMHGMAVALRDDYGAQLDQTAHDYTERIVAASHRMDMLIRDLLDHSRLTRSTQELLPVDLRHILAEAQQALVADIRDKKARIELEGSFPGVLANKTLLLQVLTNLISNAVKFVPADRQPHVIIRGEEKAGWLRISVKDNGIGIDPQYFEKIFKVFERLHSGREYPGTGIGLATVKKAVEQMGGKIGIESRPGEGSCFWFELNR